jgi:uncharacterized protein (TIGR02757 family)
MNTLTDLKTFLDKKADEYNRPSFIQDDPISVPHLFTTKQDIEIAGFFAAVFSWGNRSTIISKGKELMQRMDMAPYLFIKHHSEKDLKRLAAFKHRTFQFADLVYFIEFLHQHYARHKSLEHAFTNGLGTKSFTAEKALNNFRKYFFGGEHEKRTEKHIPSPQRGSTCKRLNMFLRWMVRSDDKGVDFGIWQNIPASQLICPLDVHVVRVAKKLGLLKRRQPDWQAAVELTGALRKLDENDPVRYDFALFNLGAMEKF